MSKQEEIEKPWCVYGWFLGPWGFGKIEKDSGNSIYIKYHEEDNNPECWDSKWVKKFSKLEGAVEHQSNA